MIMAPIKPNPGAANALVLKKGIGIALVAAGVPGNAVIEKVNEPRGNRCRNQTFRNIRFTK